MALGDILRVVRTTVNPNQTGINVMHYRISVVVAPEPSRQQIANLMHTTIGPLYIPLMSSAGALIRTSVQKIRPLPVEVAAEASTPTFAGGLTTDLLPGQVSGIITLRTAFAGRGFRGRQYIPWPTEGVSDSSGLPTNAYVLNLDALAQQLIVPLVVPNGAGSATIQPVIFRRLTAVSNDVTSAIARVTWATQRRRASVVPG